MFVPPAHTLRDGKPFGIWFDSLPLDLQRDVVNNFSFLLAACIRSRVHTSLRSERPDILALIQNSTSDGYFLLSDLALHVGRHPMLCKFGSKNQEPRQSADTTLTKYIADWRQYMHHEILDGSILSDRYFHQQFLHNMHPQVRGRIGNYLLQAVMSIPFKQPLPPSFAPNRLLSHITQHVQHLGTRQLLDHTPRQLAGGPTMSTSTYSNPGRSRDQPRSNTTASATTSSQIESLIVAAMRTPGPCLLCRSTEHLFAQCPSLAALRDQPTLVRILQQTLQRISTSGSGTHAATQSRSQTTSSSASVQRRQMRQLTSGGETSSAPTADSASPIDSPDLLLLPPSSAGEGHSSDARRHSRITMSMKGFSPPMLLHVLIWSHIILLLQSLIFLTLFLVPFPPTITIFLAIYLPVLIFPMMMISITFPRHPMIFCTFVPCMLLIRYSMNFAQIVLSFILPFALMLCSMIRLF
jgi:hypothetical protein